MTNPSFTRYFTFDKEGPKRWVIVRYVNVAVGTEVNGTCYMRHHGRWVFKSQHEVDDLLGELSRLGAKRVSQWPPPEDEL